MNLQKLRDNLRNNALEYYTITMILVGLPLVINLFFGWKYALAGFVTLNVIIGLYALRNE